jgi:glycosyltransferase involved in cell wall biosynthesis
MKIIVDARLILPKQTGIGRYLISLAEAYSAMPGSDEFEFWVQDKLPSDHQVWSLQRSRVKVRRLPVSHMSLRQQWAIPLQIMRTAHDVFHYPHFDLPFITPGKTVVTLYDLKYIVHPDFFPQMGKTKQIIMQIMMAYAARRARRVITVSNNSLKDIVHWLRIPKEKIRVTHLGVDSRYYTNPDPREIEAYRKRISLEDPFILYVGERRPHKNIIGVIQAFQTFISMSSIPYKLVIAGKPYADYNEPERLVETMKLANRIRFLDSPPDGDVRLLLKSSEVLMLLSRYEGFGLPLLEAMASGTPVISSDATSLPEIVDDAGMVVPVDQPIAAAEALRQVVVGGEKRELMIARGRERASLFTWERCAQETINTYHEI